MENAGWRINANTPGGDLDPKLSEEQIAGIRNQIDDLDQAISRLISQRLTLARQLTQAKTKLGLPVLDSSRENEVLNKVTSHLSDPPLAQAVQAIYEEIMAQSRKLQSEDL